MSSHIAGQVIGGTIAAFGTAASIVGREDTKAAREQAAELRFQQQQISAEQASTVRTRRLNTVLASQIANAGARGFTAASPTLFAT